MPGLFGAIDDDVKLGLLTAALAAMSARGVKPGTALAQGGLLGLGAMQNAKAGRADAERQKREDDFRQMQMDEYRRKLEEAQTQKQALSQAFQGAMIPGQQAQPPVEFGGGEGTRPGMPAQAPGFDYGKFAQMIGPHDPSMAMQALGKLAPKEKELKETRTLMRNGQRVTVNFYKDGTHEVVPFDPDAEKPHYVNTGDRVGVPLDPYKGTPLGQGLPAGMGPADAQRIALERAKFGYQQGRDRVADARGNAPDVPKVSGELRKEFNQLPQVKSYGEVQPVIQSAREAVKDDTAAADLNIIYAAAKIFDPTSVVRESETTMVVNSGSPAQRFMGQWDYVAGGGRLTPQARKQLMAQIESRARGYESGYKAARKAYEGVASKVGADPAQVFIEPFAGSGQVLKFDAQGNLIQ